MTPVQPIFGNYWAGKAAVVTGGARGQGACITRLLVQGGAHVHVMDCLAAREPAWAELRQSCAGLGGSLDCLELDVGDPEAWDMVAAAVRGDARGARRRRLRDAAAGPALAKGSDLAALDLNVDPHSLQLRLADPASAG